MFGNAERKVTTCRHGIGRDPWVRGEGPAGHSIRARGIPENQRAGGPDPPPRIGRPDAGGVRGQLLAFARSSSSWHVMQSLAKGNASRRRSLIISPHDSHRP